MNTMPKNGGGNGKNTNPINKQSPPIRIKAIDFKFDSLRTTKPCFPTTALLHALSMACGAPPKECSKTFDQQGNCYCRALGYIAVRNSKLIR